MKQMTSNSTILNLEQLPLFQKNPTCSCNSIACYLGKLGKNKLNQQTHYLELPSVSKLSGFFDCSCMEMHDALRALRDRGYDYQFSSLDGAVMIWHQINNVKKEK